MILNRANRLFILAALVMALLVAGTPLLAVAAAQATVEQTTAQWSDRLENTMTEARIPGVAWAVVHQGEIVDLSGRGFIDSSRSARINPDTVFRIASVSKGFAGVLAAMLAVEGQINLQDPIQRYAPSFRFNSPAADHLTIEDVLGQRSGLVPNAYDNLIESGMPRQQIYGHFEALAPVCPPGTCYSYQNSVFSLVEDVVERSTSVPYPQLLQQRIFDPLQMVNASVGYEALNSAGNRAEPHVKTRSGWREIRPRSSYYQVSSAAGINASIRDMAIWANAMLGHFPEVISPEAIQTSLRPAVRTRNELRHRSWRGALTDAHYALGWRIYRIGNESLALHSGWVAGYRAEIALSHAHDLGIVLLMNAESRAISELNSAFWSATLPRLAPAAIETAKMTSE